MRRYSADIDAYLGRGKFALASSSSRGDYMSETRSELERQQLLKECHSLIASIGQSAYSTKLLKAARDGLLLIAGYKTYRRIKN